LLALLALLSLQVDRVLWRIRDMSRIVSSFFMLRRKNSRLLVIMLAILPIRVLWGETLNGVSVRHFLYFISKSPWIYT